MIMSSTVISSRSGAKWYYHSRSCGVLKVCSTFYPTVSYVQS